jgi:uroporphyrinogen-III synthase
MEQAIRKIAAGEADVILWTNAQQIEFVLQTARKMNLEKELKAAMNQTFTASIGPIASDALRERGLRVDFEPSQSKMGVLVSELASQLPKLRRSE